MTDGVRPPDIVFPHEQAEALRIELRRCASYLNDALNARVQASERVDPFEGNVAEAYRSDMKSYRKEMEATIDRFRLLATTVDNLISERQAAIQQRKRDQDAWDLEKRSPRYS